MGRDTLCTAATFRICVPSLREAGCTISAAQSSSAWVVYSIRVRFYAFRHLQYFTTTTSYYITPSTIYLTGHADEIRCFHCGGGFRGWLRYNDDQWQLHIKWFPICVYEQYVTESNKQRPDFAVADDGDSNVSKNQFTIV